MINSQLLKRSLLLVVAAAWSLSAADAIKIHPDNPKYFLFRGKPLVLLTASEHYGSVINRPFDFEKYLNYAAEHKLTVTRTFLLFRELQSARNPSSPAKPESPDYIAPFRRVGPEKALDGEPIYDLDQWSPEYFDRLHRFLEAASQKGILVELTVFSNTYAENVWALNPFRAENNKQHIGKVEWPEYLTLRDPELVRRQQAYARKVMQETSGYDNVYYEICNEPGGDVKDHAPSSEVDAWQQEMGRTMRDELQRLGHPHLLAGQQAFAYSPKFRFPLDQTFSGRLFDIVNVHPLPDTELGGHLFQLGNFMSKELMASQVADFTRAAFPLPKPMVMDEDNTASMYRDDTGWTIHRKRAWLTLINGGHYDYIDFSITVGSEAGTRASRPGLAVRMQHLSEFMSSFDYVHAKPSLDWVQHHPEHLVPAASVVSDRDFVLYLADDREAGDPSAGSILTGDVSFTLPAGDYIVRFYSPQTGEYSPGVVVKGGQATTVSLPDFRQDIVLRAQRKAP